MDYKRYFKGKKITVMGLGLLGRGLHDTEFLAECGADLLVTDLRDEKILAPSVKLLKKFPNIKFVLGGHRLEDFSARGGQAQPDFILKSAGVPLDSEFVAEARKNKIPIKMSASWFAELAEGVKIIGITGTRGKSTVTQLIYEILKKSGKRVFLGGNVRGISTLALLKEIQPGDFVVMELDSWQLQGFGDARISPQVSVFTNFLEDHLNYYKNDRARYFADKANIFQFQTPADFLVAGEKILPGIKKFKPKAQIIKVNEKDFPEGWQLKLIGEHNLLNAILAVKAVEVLGIKEVDIKSVVESFSGLAGRLQLVYESGGVKIYNDNNSTTPEATTAALRALDSCLPVRQAKFEARNSKQIQNPKSGNSKRIVLIMGGADKGLDTSKLVEEISKYCKAVILLPGTGSEKLQVTSYTPAWPAGRLQGIPVYEVATLKESMKKALNSVEKGDIILFSPAFASFGLFQNEYDRGDQFLEVVGRLVDKN